MALSGRHSDGISTVHCILSSLEGEAHLAFEHLHHHIGIDAMRGHLMSFGNHQDDNTTAVIRQNHVFYGFMSVVVEDYGRTEYTV